ncbi:MAG TPA: TrkA family potassium uptake protein [Thermoanaerobaculia bacterium]|nr:TrkA family potassium uptake protein [Thermoanaerobaculia bacterium]
MARIAVIGLGRFGAHVAREAFHHGHEVLAIGIDPEAVQRLRDHATRAVVADARDLSRLRALRLGEEFDAVVVSLGENVEASALIVLHLRELGAPRIIAKAGSDDHGKLLSLIGAHEVLFPERESAARLAMRLAAKNLFEYLPLGEAHGVEEIATPARFVGKSLAELALPDRYGSTVLAVRKAGRRELLVGPGADYVVTAEDLLVVLAPNEALQKLQQL